MKVGTHVISHYK